MDVKLKFYAAFGENGESLGNFYSKQEALAAVGEYYMRRYPFDATILELNATVSTEEGTF